MRKAMTDFVMTFSLIHAFGGSCQTSCQDLNHQQPDGMHPNQNLCQPDLMRTKASDLFPMPEIELMEDFLLLGNSDLLYLME